MRCFLVALLLSLVVGSGCVSAAKKIGTNIATGVSTSVNNSQLTKLDEELAAASAPSAPVKPNGGSGTISVPVTDPDSGTPTPISKPSNAPAEPKVDDGKAESKGSTTEADKGLAEASTGSVDISLYDTNKDGKLTWQDFDTNKDGVLEANEGLMAEKVIAILWAKKGIADAKARIAAGESITTVAKDEFKIWWGRIQSSLYTVSVLGLLGLVIKKLAEGKSKEKVKAVVDEHLESKGLTNGGSRDIDARG